MQIDQLEYQDQLVRGLAHRMNNILTLFHGYLGLVMENKALDSQAREGLAKIKDGAHAASELMDRTHALVRPTSIVWREINIAEFIRTLRPAFDAFRTPKTQLVFDLPDDLPPICADTGRVKTAIVELVRNALEATSAGGQVEVSVRAASAPGGKNGSKPASWLAIRVIDDGPGITERVGERIFQPFFTTKKKKNAAGLGLAVVLNFARQHEGTLRYESRRGHTVFELLLPCQRTSQL